MAGDRGNLPTPPLEIYCQRLVEAWNSLFEEMIKKSFKSHGISNQNDGSKDSLVHRMQKDQP